MSEENIAIMRQIYDEVITKGNIDLIDELMSADFVEFAELPGIPPTREGVKMFMTAVNNAFPDFTADVADIFASGDKVVARGRFTGTHNGEFMDLPATGNPVSVEFIDIIEFRDSKAVAHWGLMDTMALMEQLGVLPE